MSPEAVNYMSVAEYHLERAERALMAELFEDAARHAYLVGLNAARGMIFEKTATAPKSHSGTGTMLHQLIHGGLAFPRELTLLLSKGFETKQNADYGPPLFVTSDEAQDFLERARAFLAAAKAACA